jgi:hypothetical protein
VVPYDLYSLDRETNRRGWRKESLRLNQLIDFLLAVLSELPATIDDGKSTPHEKSIPPERQ